MREVKPYRHVAGLESLSGQPVIHHCSQLLRVQRTCQLGLLVACGVGIISVSGKASPPSASAPIPPKPTMSCSSVVTQRRPSLGTPPVGRKAPWSRRSLAAPAGRLHSEVASESPCQPC